MTGRKKDPRVSRRRRVLLRVHRWLEREAARIEEQRRRREIGA